MKVSGSMRLPRKRKTVIATGVLGGTLVVTGALGLGGAAAQEAEGGHFTSPSYRFTSSANALVSDEIEVENGRPGDPAFDIGELANLRIRATSSKPLFVGIGPKRDVDAYVRGMAHDRMTAVQMNPFRVDFTRSPGTSAPQRPTAQKFWVATGRDTLSWDKSKGTWSIVVMNADATPGVDAKLDVGFRFGFLRPAGAGLLGGGLALLTMTLIAERKRRCRPARIPS